VFVNSTKIAWEIIQVWNNIQPKIILYWGWFYLKIENGDIYQLYSVY
jgi:hypothetical protein